MHVSEAGRHAIMDFEGVRSDAYQDVAGVWTIGVGHTGSDVQPDSKWTQSHITEVLAADLVRFEVCVATSVKRMLTQGQFDALVSLAFNIGEHAFKTSTLVSKLNGGDVKGAALQFTVWNKAGGIFNRALLARRTAELWMFARAS